MTFVSLVQLYWLTPRGHGVTSLMVFAFFLLKGLQDLYSLFLNTDYIISSCHFLNLTLVEYEMNPWMSGVLTCRTPAVFDDLTVSRSGQSQLSSYHFCLKASVHTCPSRQEEMILPVRESMECIVRPPVSGDEAPRTLKQTNDQPHLTAAVKTPTAQTAPAKGTFMDSKVGSTMQPWTNSSVFY